MRGPLRLRVLALLGPVLVVAAAMACNQAASSPQMRSSARQPLPALTPAPNVTGSPEKGRQLFLTKPCVQCHTVAGLTQAPVLVGPPLNNMALRPTIAGETIPNNPGNMAKWLMDPPSMKPGTPMPVLGLTEQEAQDLTAFLYAMPHNPAGR